jgi:hypothetical protein
LHQLGLLQVELKLNTKGNGTLRFKIFHSGKKN